MVMAGRRKSTVSGSCTNWGMKTELSDPGLLKPAEVASRLRVSQRTVRRYGIEGRLEVVRLSARTLRYSAASIEALLAPAHQAGRGRGSSTTTNEVMT